MTKAEEAYQCFMSRFTCSAAVFSAFAGELGLDPDTAKKVACGFGGGMSHTGNICGAVSGAIMVIGLKYGKTEAGDDDATEKTRVLVRQFIKEFIELHGSINCTELLGYDLSKADELQEAREKNLFKTICPGFVHDASAILEKIL